LIQKQTIKPATFFLLALFLFSLLGLEFLVFFLSRLVDGRSMAQLFNWPVHWYGAVFHWTVTILVWAAGATWAYFWAKRKGVIPDLVRFKFKQRDGLLLVIGIAFVIAYELVYSRLVGNPIPQIWREYQGFQNMYGNQAWIVSVFQNMYYLMEFVIVVLMLAFFQRGGELGFKISWFPWGSVGLAVTWGTIHLVTNPQGAVGVILWAMLMGIFFVLTKKNFFTVWLVGLLGFIV
jgi:hypothetical protein